MGADGPIDRRVEAWRRRRADRRFFRHLIQVHGLGREEALLLTALAEKHALVRRSEIFFRPSLLEARAGAGIAEPDALLRLSRRVFGDAALHGGSPAN